MKKLLISLTITFTLAQAHALSFWSGQDLMDALKSDNAVHNAVAFGYIMGAHDKAEGRLHCTPPEATPEVIVALTIIALKKNQDKLHLTADRFVSENLINAFPCTTPIKI